MKTITIKVDDKYAGIISATFIGSNQARTYVSSTAEQLYDNMVITIDDSGKAKTEDI
ncbi:MAG TPA: hypothetical protein VFD00_02195 [Thermoclostridium sp.]|nr:hypothetical protein [Thermoclostridium sp.]